MASSTAIVAGAGWLRAKPNAAAMNGAVQGVATITASTPVKKSPAGPLRPVSSWPVPAESSAARAEALVWALERGSRSGRVAFQFARDYAGQHASA